jgi:flagellar biosynthesis GTPase FlhF
MQIHRIRGRDLREALERAGREHGPQALVLGHETLPGGGVTVAVADARRSQMIARTPASPPPSTGRPPGFDDVERVLLRSGTSPALIEDVLAEIERSRVRGAYALDRAATLLAGRLRIAPSPKLRRLSAQDGRRPCVLAFCGPRKAGKTTTVAKLTARLARAGRRVGLVTLDGSRPGAVGQLTGYAELLHAPVDTARTTDELRRLVDRSRNLDAVLIDGSGRAAHDVATLRELRAIDPDTRLVSYLVGAATTERPLLDAAFAEHAPLDPDALVVTQLDETREPAPVLEHAIAADLPLAFLCDGADVGGHLRRPKPDDLADLFLRGRLA